MQYEFDYFYEPADEEKPIQKLGITLTLEVESDVHPASYDWKPVKAYSMKVKSFTVHNRMGMDVSQNFAFLKDKIEAEFRALHEDRALQRFLND